MTVGQAGTFRFIVNVTSDPTVTSPTSVVTDAYSLVRTQCAWLTGYSPSAIWGHAPGAGPMSTARAGVALTTTQAVANNAMATTIDPMRRITSPSLSRADQPSMRRYEGPGNGLVIDGTPRRRLAPAPAHFVRRSVRRAPGRRTAPPQLPLVRRS